MSSVALANLEQQFERRPQALLEYLSGLFGLETMTAEEMRECRPAFDALPYVEAVRRACVVLRLPSGALLAVLGDPYDGAAQDRLEEHLRQAFTYRLAHRTDIAAYLARQEEGLRAMEGVDHAADEAPQERAGGHDVSMEEITSTDSPVVKLVSSMIHDAIKAGASDIHFETGAVGLVVKYRIDGVLAIVKTAAGTGFAEQALSRIKVMSELDIAERRIPQDGRFRARNGNREIDFRVSVMPNVFGEDAVLRILDKRSLSDELCGLNLERLGFDQQVVDKLRELSAEPHGMLLVTGPTGSGKTTTLYAAISEANNGLDKIITIEDPVEYQLPGVLQIPVNEKKGLTFARGLRSILRHDPDRIMVGEIRDPETAEIAVQSALTGHLVYTTVHANSVYDVIGRFMHMGADVFNLASALNAVMAQRLVRVLCSACSGKGCGECRGTGYRGRKAIAELMIINDELRELIVGRAPRRKLKEATRASGARDLRDAAIELVNRRETTLDEVNRVAPAG